MNNKNPLLLPILSLIGFVIAGVTVAFLVLDLKKSENIYVQEAKVSKSAGKEAEINVILSDIKKEVNLPFANVISGSFVWRVESEGEIKDSTISGWNVDLRNITMGDTTKVVNYLKKYGFTSDLNNAAAGAGATLSGYVKGQYVCLVLDEVSKSTDSSGVNLRNLKISCGYR